MARFRNVCITLNNPTFSPDEFKERLLSLGVSYYVFQVEHPEGGTRHFQAYIELNGQKSLSRLQAAIPRGHFESRRGSSKQASDYCKKEESRVDGPWEYGTLSAPGKRNDLAAAVEIFREKGMAGLIAEEPTAYVKYHRGFEKLAFKALLGQTREVPEVWFLYGPPGCGKTRRAFAECESRVGGSYGLDFVKLCLADGWFDGYLGQPAVILDDLDGNKSKISLARLLQVLDIYPTLVPIKGDHVPFVSKLVLVTSNYHWSEWYDFTDRAAQYPALVRRFTRVLAWPGSDGLDPVDIRPGTPSWDTFREGPRTHNVIQNPNYRYDWFNK